MKRDQAIGIIAARGGSKGLPGKNVIDLLGKPMEGTELGKCRIVATNEDCRIGAVRRSGCYETQIAVKRLS